ncbi:MAG: sigma-70 family RNA polymerase sigma factor, partial [Bacteroidota bacterium]
FVKVFSKIDAFRGTGELGAWIRRIMVNAALMNYRKQKKHQGQVDLDEVSFVLDSGYDIFRAVSARDLMFMIQQLPSGYRLVFNLYAIEGFNHREIAEKLNISVGTSKSQFSRARAMLRGMIEMEEKKVSGRAI